MSLNTCPCCKGHARYSDIKSEESHFLCAGCEIELYAPLHKIMNEMHISKEEAYEILKNR